MNRFRFGAALLVLLLAASLWAQWGTRALHAPIARAITQSAEACSHEDWQTAEAARLRAYEAWLEARNLTAALNDQQYVEEADALFAQLPVYARNQDQTEYITTCRTLALRILSLSEAHRWNWWNVF